MHHLVARVPLPSAHLRRFLTFCAIGLSGAVVNTAVLALLNGRLHWPVVVASAFATELAIANNFLLNDRLTFASGGASPRRFLRFNLVALGGLAITVATVTVITSRTTVPVLAANAAGIVLATAWNFAASVRWTWADHLRARDAAPRLTTATSSI